jgi:hypothetical protein
MSHQPAGVLRLEAGPLDGTGGHWDAQAAVTKGTR